MAKRRKKEKNYYFSEKEEQALIKYANSDDFDERNRIYEEILKEPFQKMVEIIVRRYPMHIGNYDIKEVEQNALSHLTEQMVKFNPYKITKSGKKAKAFSYCQTIVRNYCKDHSKRSYGEKKNYLSFEDYSDEIITKSEYIYEIDNENEDQINELINRIIDKIRDRIDGDKSLKKNEIIVGEAIINVLSNWEDLFLEDTPIGKFNKKVTNNYQKNKILLLLKEQTGLTTKEMRMSMKQFKEMYYLTKDEFYNEEY
ncbi:MAG: hypothetical protein ACOCVF_01790 [bacterium]